MKYMGSKNRIAKHILPIMLAERKPNQWWVEPFVGGANMIDKVGGNRIGADSNEHLIAMWQELQKGWIPPDFIEESLWKDVKEKMYPSYEKHFIAFTRLGCSFGADWNGGYARNVRKDKPNAELLNSTTKSYCRQSKNNILKQLPNLQGVNFIHSNYDQLEIPNNSVIYCDPPYEGTTKYKDDFDHNKFWDWCRTKTKSGHTVFISEYSAPNDFVCVKEIQHKTTLDKNSQYPRIEKLFRHKDGI
jgi:DNA adenine methylase